MYLGYAAIFLQADPRLESAITAVQAVSDGGTRPDNSSELAVRNIITQLQAIDTARQTLIPMMFVNKADEAGMDPVKADCAYRIQARTYVHRLARFMDTEPRADIYSAGYPQPAYPSAPFGGRLGY